MFKHVSTLIASILMLCSFNLNAEQMKKLGDWDVHYIALGTTFLTPEVARAYGIQRSRYNGLINISVLNSQSKQAQSVAMTGTAKNLLGVVKDLSFKEVKEGDAIYSLAVLPFRNEEQYQININIRHGNELQKLNFKHKFYAE